MTDARINRVPTSLLILVGALAALVIVLAGIAIRASSSRRGAGPDQERAEVPAGTAASARHAEMGSRRTTWPSASAGAPVPAPTFDQHGEAAGVEPSAPIRRSAARIPPKPTTQEIARGLDLRLEHEPVDAAWATRTSSTLSSEVYAARIEHTSVAAVRCASTMCRLTLEHSEPIDGNHLVSTLSSREPFYAGAYFSRDEAAHRTIVYVARPGHQLFGGGADLSAENR